MAKETLEMVSNPSPLLTDDQVNQEDELKETEASLTAEAAIPVSVMAKETLAMVSNPSPPSLTDDQVSQEDELKVTEASLTADAAKETLEMVSNPPPPLLTDGADQVSQGEDEIKETEASLTADAAKETLEMVSNPPPPLLTDGADQVSQGEDEIKETEASLTADAAIPVQEEAQSIMEPSFTVLKGSKKRKQNRRLESGLPMKKKRHLCCSTCVGDHTYSPLCYVLEDKQERCLCQQAKSIMEDELGIVGDKKIVYMERIRATPHGNATVRYEDVVAFTGEMQRCTVCLTDIGHRYLGTVGRNDGREMVMSDTTRQMTLMGGPIQRYFLLDRKKLKIVKIDFQAKQGS